MYEDKIVGGAIPQQFIPSIEKGIVKTMAEGVLSGNPMVDVKVTLSTGSSTRSTPPTWRSRSRARSR